VKTWFIEPAVLELIIGQNLVTMMIEGAGFKVVDLGADGYGANAAKAVSLVRNLTGS
jgi:cobalamin-dependent methionine synthase I